MKKKQILLLLITIPALLSAATVQAVCPVCTIAVGTGLGLSRWLGINDAVTGLWIGGLVVSLIIWTADWLNKRFGRSVPRDLFVVAGYYLAVIVPLYYARIITNPVDFLCSCARDNLIIGIMEGSTAFYFGAAFYDHLKAKNGGHAYFPFQKAVMPVIILVFFTIIFFFLTK